MPSYALDFQHLAERVEAASFEIALPLDDETGPEARLREYEEALLEEASSLRTELDAAVQTWIASGKFPALPPRTKRFLYYRFLAAFRFLYLLSVSSGEVSIFRVADMRERQFLAWLLCVWGHEHGTIEGLSDHDHSSYIRRDFGRKKT